MAQAIEQARSRRDPSEPLRIPSRQWAAGVFCFAMGLARTDFGPETQTYLVDPTGRLIAHPDQDLVASFADLSARPSVAAMLADPAPVGALSIGGPRGGTLTSYARVPGLGWGVVMERPAAAALEVIHTKLDLLFGGLLLVIGAAAGFGTLTASWLSRPLAIFGAAVDDLGAGDGSAPLPAGGYAVKRRWPGVRFLLATGWGAAIDPGEARARGVEAVLSKPYHPADLVRALARTDAAA